MAQLEGIPPPNVFIALWMQMEVELFSNFLGAGDVAQ